MKLLLVFLVIAAFIGIAFLKWNAANYPKPRNLPSVVSASTDELLARLQITLEKNAPEAARALQPGLSHQEILDLENKGGFRLSEDLRALYRWHNGMNFKQWPDLVPGGAFLSLDEVVRNRAGMSENVRSATLLQRTIVAVLSGDRMGWLHVMDDGAGDGYFFDPGRREAEGAFFYNFGETGSFIFFPSFRNFLAGVIECYDTGVFKLAVDGKSFESDYKREEKVWQRLAEIYESLNQ